MRMSDSHVCSFSATEVFKYLRGQTDNKPKCICGKECNDRKEGKNAVSTQVQQLSGEVYAAEDEGSVSSSSGVPPL